MVISFENNARAEQLTSIDDIPWITKYNFRPMEEYIRIFSKRKLTSSRTFS